MFNPTEFSYWQWLLVPLIIFGRYLVFAGTVFALFYLWKRREWLYLKIQQRFPSSADYWREVGYSSLTSLIFGLAAWLCLGTSFHQYTQFYTRVDTYGIAWLLLSIPISLLIHDTYFYWMHRLMHHPALYRKMHLVHHKSVNPSPWAAFAFHPLEAVVEAGIIPVLLLLMPLHPISFFGFVLFMLLFNVYGHLGYELFPKWIYEHPVGKWLNSSVYHNLHHEKFTGNFGLYFTFWDRLCGTLRDDSIQKIAEIHHRKSSVMSAKNTLLAFTLFCSAALSAQSINWATDIAPILYENCAKCHRDGGLGHFSLIGYANAFTRRYDIQDAAGARRMPPWMPDPSYRRYAHETRLTDEEIQRINQWVDGGAPGGDLAQAPPDPMFSNDSEVGMPDQILFTPFFTVTATDDEYRCFVIPNGLNQPAFLRGLEAIPGNHEVVHHILIYEDTTGQGKVLDAQTPNEPGYVNFGGPGVNGARLVGAWVPGSRTFLTPPSMGVKLSPGADLIVQMHYPKGVTGMSDQTKLNLFFTPTNQGIREIKLTPALNHTPFSLENGPLNIPPNQIKTYHAKFTLPQTVSILSVAPHMHLIGRSIESFAVTPLNDTIPLIRINNWDFHWQGAYYFQHLQRVPIGSKLHAYAVYDNTENNPHQPSSPPQTVTQGEATTDEMMLVYFAYTEYKPGDENILLDSALLNSSVNLLPVAREVLRLDVCPNPAQEMLQCSFEPSQPAAYTIRITNTDGRLMESLAGNKPLSEGIIQEQINIQSLPPGSYFMEVLTDQGEYFTTRFIKG